jgi:hypothetical protein
MSVQCRSLFYEQCVDVGRKGAWHQRKFNSINLQYHKNIIFLEKISNNKYITESLG